MFTHDRHFGLQVLVNGQPLQEYPYQGEWFVEGIIGRNFTLRLLGKAQLSRRAVAVVSVDGLSIMDGKPAKTDGSGYIIEAGEEHIDIPGWRLTNKEVAAFFFSSLPEAYASQLGKPTNIGVIGVKFFYERLPEQPEKVSPDAWGTPLPPAQEQPLWGSTPPPPAPAPAAPGRALSGTPLPPPQAPSAPGVGTGFGDRQAHSIYTVHFERDHTTAQTLVLRYDTSANLEARGIVLEGRGDRAMKADPFPGDSGCTPPPGWRG